MTHWDHSHHCLLRNYLKSIKIRQAAHSNQKALPLHKTAELEPMFVKPVLQVHLTAFVLSSWEQAAFAPHPPLFTRQLSAKHYKTMIASDLESTVFPVQPLLPVHSTFESEPVFV